MPPTHFFIELTPQENAHVLSLNNNIHRCIPILSENGNYYVSHKILEAPLVAEDVKSFLSTKPTVSNYERLSSE